MCRHIVISRIFAYIPQYLHTYFGYYSYWCLDYFWLLGASLSWLLSPFVMTLVVWRASLLLKMAKYFWQSCKLCFQIWNQLFLQGAFVHFSRKWYLETKCSYIVELGVHMCRFMFGLFILVTIPYHLNFHSLKSWNF